MEAALAFRRETADLVDEPVTPPDPAAFLQTLVKTARTLATSLTADLPPDADDVLQDQMSHLATEIESNANAVEPRLAEAQFGSFDTISAALDFDYSWKLYAARRIRRVHGDALNEKATTQLDDLIDTLERFGPAREHVKTLYFRWELVNLSWMVIATAIPALTVAVCTLLYYDTRLLVGSIAGIPASVLVVSGAVTVSLTPFVVLLAYILRIATISKRTLSIGPFTLRPTDRGEFEADGG